ncbi:phage minor head protein [Methanolobus sp. WCC5]|uniref:phage minor head protein n=1 Tax=Methanolobus sp. WCC5 TaxID=3125785 RepID=UPI003254A616
MASEIDPETFDQQVDQLVLATTAAQSEALTKAVTAYYKAGSDDVRPSTRLTNVQRNAIKRLSAEHFGYISEFNVSVGEQIKRRAKELLNQEKGYKEISDDIRKYAEDLFKGSEKVVIDNTGKTRTIFKVGKDGTIRKTSKVIERPYVTNVKAYSDMLARTATHTAWEQGRASEYQRMGFKKWRFVGPSDERARPDHIAVLGQVFEYGTEQSDYAEALLHEPNCRHRQVVYFDDPELDTSKEFFEDIKRRAGLYWDEEKEEWGFR